jgi:hypothetical protein
VPQKAPKLQLIVCNLLDELVAEFCEKIHASDFLDFYACGMLEALQIQIQYRELFILYVKLPCSFKSF